MLDDITSDDIILLAYALEYDYEDSLQSKINEILDKVTKGIHLDCEEGCRIAEYGRTMGWSVEESGSE